MQYIRELGVTESLASLINSAIPHNVIAMTTLPVFIKDIDISRLVGASKFLQKKYPLLSCVIKDNSFYQKSNPASPIVICEKDECLTDTAEKALKVQLSDDSSLFKVMVSPNCGQTNILLLAQHTVCDGKSIAVALLDLLSYYDQLLDSLTCVQPLLGRHFPCLESMLPEVSPPCFSINESAYEPIFSLGDVRSTSTGLCAFSLTSSESSLLLASAKRLGVNVQNFVSSIAMLTLKKFKKSQSSTIGYNVMVDMRPYFVSPVSSDLMGFYSSYTHIDYSVSQKDRKQAARDLDHQVKNNLLEGWHISAVNTYKTLLESGITSDELLDIIKVERPTLGISNVGVVGLGKSFENFMPGPLFVCASSNSYSRNQDNFFVCLSTYGGRVSLVLHHSLPSFSRERAVLFIKEIYQELVSFSEELSLTKSARKAEASKQSNNIFKPASKLLSE